MSEQHTNYVQEMRSQQARKLMIAELGNNTSSQEDVHIFEPA